MEALRALRRHITLKRVLIILILLVVVSPTISYYHRNMPPSVQTEEQDPIAGETGFAVEREYCAPLREVTIYDGLVSDTGADWYLENEDRPTLLEWNGILDVTEGEGAVIVHLKGQAGSGSYIQDSRATFTGRPTLPIMNYSDIISSVSVTVLQGSVNVSLYASYRERHLGHWRTGANTTATVEAGESSTIDIHPSIANLHNLTTSWVAQCRLRIELVASQESIISIGRVTITASSYEDLYPVSFDMQAPDGASLFSNPYTDKMGGYYRIGWFSAYDQLFYPGLLTTYSGTGDPGVYTPNRVNDTIYLRSGNYSGSAGWVVISYTAYPYESFDFNITVNSYESVSVQVRIPASQLRISISPTAAYSGIEIGYRSYTDLYDIDYPLVGSDFLYLPPVSHVTMVVRPVQYTGVPYDEDHFYYSRPMAQIGIRKLADSSVLVSVAFPESGILGLMLDVGQLIGLFSLFALSLIPISLSLRNQYSRAGGNTHLLIPLTLFISVLTPWVNYSFETVSYPPTEVGAAVFVPLLMTFWYGPETLITPSPNTYLHPNLLALGILYWTPIIILLYDMTTSKTSDDEEGKIPGSMLQGLAIMLGPLMIGSFYLWFCFLGLCTPSIGLIACLLAFPLWLMDGTISKYRRYQLAQRQKTLE